MLTFCFLAKAQCPNGNQDHYLSSQERVDAFVAAYSGCQRIEGNIDIVAGLVGTEDTGEVQTPITDITGLYFLKVINGDLRISVDVEELDGFNNLTDVNGDFVITSSNSLIKISGFNNLLNARNVTIALNPVLTDVSGFRSLIKVFKSLEIGDSPGIQNITGFENLQTIGGELNISKNPVLKTIPSFNNLETIGDDLNLTSNPILEEAIGFGKLVSIGNDLNIENVKIIRGFQQLRTIERFFDIRGNGVEELPSFPLLEIVGAAFRIESTSVRAIAGYNSLKSVGEQYFLEDWFIVSNNRLLSSVIGFGQFEKVEGNVEVQNNPLLSDCSWLCNIINNGEITGALTIQNNLGNCINSLKVILICDIDFDDDTIANVVDLDDDNDGVLDVLEGDGTKDTDKDGYPDSMDLDSDNDGCFDVLEAGFEDPNNDGVLGDLPNDVDFNGLIINETTGYTDPADRNSNSLFDFQELNIPSPGKNNRVELCKNSDNIDLFDILLGSPDPGGTWSPSLKSGTGVFNVKEDRDGVYTYKHTDPVCGNLTAEVKVVFSSELDPGLDSEVVICDGVVELNLFEAINGNPSPNGFWSPELASGTNIYNKNLDIATSYNYVLVDRECGTLQSKVTIIESTEPNSGLNGVLEICEFADQVNLFDYLEGTPDMGGSWSPSLLNDLFNPSINNSGIYTYTIDNGPCGRATSTVNVEVVRNSELNNVRIQVNDFSSTNNSIEVFVFSKRAYEYSLDGVTYQLDPVFNNVSGGTQMVFVRGIDGCEFYNEEVFVRTYSSFFTPNNDGKNDFWRLKDFPDINYTIFIYSRFGRLIKIVSSATGFWDGKENGKEIQSSDYWFKVITESGEVLHGNFSLLRK
ncbi:T9SS type B sorting domain-containing protein [Polaribacter sp.]|uniref:T9SS type B sorting domain-containing protein n=1 Tax=Polaribacter sp. TaxID=1920175 RepID=UPI0025EAF197|nr:T9SS type B sorting domain-containing protein [Polaribacter sp.]